MSREPEPVGERIRRLREAKNMSQEALARACQVSVGQVSKWERGVNEPRLPHIRCLLTALQTDLDTLLGG